MTSVTTGATSPPPPTSTNVQEGTKMASSPRQLRIGTYLCPSLPVELFQLLAEFLEEDLGCETSLMYEWRAAGPIPNRADPFLNNILDLGKFTYLNFTAFFIYNYFYFCRTPDKVKQI